MTTALDTTFGPMTPRRIPSDGSIKSPNSVLVIPSSPRRRCTLEEMQQSCCMLDYSTSSLDFPPMLPSRHSSVHGSEEGHSSSCPSLPAHVESEDCDQLFPRERTNSRDEIVQVLLPGSPNKKRAPFTFSRSVSELPRAGASRRRRSDPSVFPPRRFPSDPTDAESTSQRRRDFAPILPTKSS